MRTQVNPNMYEMELKDFISSLKGLHKAEGVPEETYVEMLKNDWKEHKKPIINTIKKGAK